MRSISLGWGAQSFALAAMSALGVLPHVDVVIHADTTHEQSATYEFARRWTPWLEAHGMHVVTVKPDRCYTSPIVDDWGGIYIPAYTGSGGQLRRQCTYDWKIRPIRRWLQAHRNGERVEQWIGITLDEAQRARPSRVKYIIHRWPFLERGNMMRRSDVVRWLRENLGGDAVPSRSSCYFCPYHSKREWRRIRDNKNADWQRAVAFDEALREKRPPFKLFVNPNRIPLREVDLSTPEDHGQLSFFSMGVTNA